MERRQVMERGRQHGETDGEPRGRADQMQAPAKELFLFGRTIATILPAAYFATAPRAYPATDRERNTINDKYLALQEHLPQGGGHKGHPVRERVQAAIEARDAEWPGQIAIGTHNTDCPLVMILKELGSHDHHGQDFSIRHLGKHVTAMSQAFKHRVHDDESGYNPLGVHSILPR
jgi:hypothetical protein